MVIISDTTTLSNLLVVGKINLLRNLYQEITIPPAVRDELLAFTAVRPTDMMLLKLLGVSLDGGEAEAIALAVERKADLLIVDEQAARKAAQQRGLRIIGLLGILLEAKREGLIANVQEVINELVLKAGFWVNPVLKQEVLTKRANELGIRPPCSHRFAIGTQVGIASQTQTHDRTDCKAVQARERFGRLRKGTLHALKLPAQGRLGRMGRKRA